MAGRQPSRLLVRGSHKSKFLATSFSSSGNLWVRMSREPITPGNYSRIKRLIFSMHHSIRVSIKGNNLCSELILYIIRIWCSDILGYISDNHLKSVFGCLSWSHLEYFESPSFMACVSCFGSLRYHCAMYETSTNKTIQQSSALHKLSIHTSEMIYGN